MTHKSIECRSRDAITYLTDFDLSCVSDKPTAFKRDERQWPFLAPYYNETKTLQLRQIGTDLKYVIALIKRQDEKQGEHGAFNYPTWQNLRLAEIFFLRFLHPKFSWWKWMATLLLLMAQQPQALLYPIFPPTRKVADVCSESSHTHTHKERNPFSQITSRPNFANPLSLLYVYLLNTSSALWCFLTCFGLFGLLLCSPQFLSVWPGQISPGRVQYPRRGRASSPTASGPDGLNEAKHRWEGGPVDVLTATASMKVKEQVQV